MKLRLVPVVFGLLFSMSVTDSPFGRAATGGLGSGRLMARGAPAGASRSRAKAR